MMLDNSGLVYFLVRLCDTAGAPQEWRWLTITVIVALVYLGPFLASVAGGVIWWLCGDDIKASIRAFVADVRREWRLRPSTPKARSTPLNRPRRREEQLDLFRDR